MKITKVEDNFVVQMYDNGYMIEFSGIDDKSEWKRSKIIANTDEELIALVKMILSLPKVN
jgi:hypothetical protein